jgi:hypothetical protein
MNAPDNDMAADAEVIWDVLTDRARGRKTIEYGELRNLVGSKSFHPGAWASRRLEHIQAYCWEHGLPPLTRISHEGDERVVG